MKRIAFTIFLFCFTLMLHAQVYKTVIGCTAGNLSSILSPTEKNTVTNLTITGILDAQDFKTMRDDMPVLAVIDIGSTTIAEYSGANGPLNPSSDTYAAGEIPRNSFFNLFTAISKTSLTAVTLPSTITSIGRDAFNSCSGISTLSIPSTVTNIGLWAFADCGNNLAITIPAGATAIENWAFEAFNGPITVDIGNPNYMSFNDVLFNKDTTLLIQCPVSKSGDYIIPSTVTEIGKNSFSRCSRLTGLIIIPPTVKIIGEWAFRQCTGLTGPLSIPESVDSIGNGAFYLCSALTSIYAYSKVPVDIIHSSSVFDMVNKTTCTLYVPSATKIAYQAANQWQDFSNIIERSTSFPYFEGFSSGILPYGWSQIDYQGKDQIWKFGTVTGVTIYPALTGNYVYLFSDAYGKDNTQNVDLVSPVFDFSSYTNIVLGFNHYYRAASLNPVTLYYSVNNGADWNLIHSWNTTTLNPEAFSQDLTSQVAGYSHVLFKWNYNDTWGWYWAVDDVAITADYVVDPKLFLRNMNVTADESPCYDATDTIYVADDGLPVDFSTGSTVNLIAGKSIIFFPGFHAHEGSDMYAYITTQGAYCNTLASPVIAIPDEKSTFIADEKAKLVDPDVIEKSVRVYPNPNNGLFSLQLTNIESGATVSVYNMLGARVYESKATNPDNHKVNLPYIKRGIYFVKVTDGKEQFTRKMVVN
jgi:hypothetical protein